MPSFVWWLHAIALVQAEKQILSTVIYTNNGDHLPFLLQEYQRLTPLGAQQLNTAGARIRNQYIAPAANQSTSQTWRLEPSFLNGEHLSILSTDDQYSAASAQAFMQALYPPLEENGRLSYIDASFYDANDNVITGPSSSMQYPTVVTTNDESINSLILKGSDDCPEFFNRVLNYRESDQYEIFRNGSQPVYDKLAANHLLDTFPDGKTIGFINAWYIYEYLNYQFIHNNTFAEIVDPLDLLAARVYARRVDSDPLNAIAGRTLASRVMQLFAANVLSEGQTNKVNLLFGDYKPMMSFAALAELMLPQHAAFYNLPQPGASYIFELYFMTTATKNASQYPLNTDLMVRFLYTNGTGDFDTTVEYPLFGASPSQAVMSLSDFTASMNQISIGNVSNWCNTCQSYASFCVAGGRSLSSATPRSSVSPAVAGVIGALVALVFALLILGLTALFGGVRFYRISRNRRSDLGGFKGSEKLASDQDLTLPKGGAGATVIESTAQEGRGHERVGSWELREQGQSKDLEASIVHDHQHSAAHRRASFEDDDIHMNPFSVPVKPRDSL